MRAEEGQEAGQSQADGRRRIAAYVSLAKPGLTLMSVGTALAGALLAPGGPAHPLTLLLVALGTLLVGGGAVALNQFRERAFDAVMPRTSRRPLASGSIAPVHGLVFGLSLALPGVILLACTTLLAAVLAVVTLATYVLLYTPMKRSTHFATAVGGIPGAIPPVIGWTAVTGAIGVEAYVLFLVVFLWQMPHFLALGWMYRKEYAMAGYRLLPSLDATGGITARIIMVYTCALLPASVLPYVLGMGGLVFLCLVIVAWIAFMFPVYRLIRSMNDANARRVFFASLIYIPAFFASIGLDRLINL